MAYTATDINTIFNAVLFRNADNGAINAYANQNPNSGLTDGQVRQSIETSAEVGNNIDPVIRLYEGAFNRVPDVAGLRANVSAFVGGTSLTQLAQNFLTSQEGLQRYGSVTTTTTAFVDAIYGSALNRTGSASEYAFWVNSGKSPAQVLAEISNSGEAGNKTAVGIVNFLESEAGAALTATGSAGQIPTATVQTTGTLYASNALTGAATDALVGTQAGDTFTGTVVTGGVTVQTTDTINGAAGVDTFNETVGNGTAVVPTLTNVEVVNFIGETKGQTIDLSGVTGLSLATIRGVTTGTGAAATQSSVLGGDTITVKDAVVVSFDNVQVTAGNGAETVVESATSTFGSVAVSNGTNIGTTLNINGTSTTTLTTLNLLSTGSAGNTKGNVIADLETNSTLAKETLNVIGDRDVTISKVAAVLSTFDATGLAAKINLDVGNSANITSVKLAAAADVLKLDSYAGTTALSGAGTVATLDGGAGLNTIGANTAILGNLLADGNKVTNFQILEVQDSFAAGGTFDISKVAGLTSLQLDATTTTAAATTFNGLTTGGSIAFLGDTTTTGGALSFGITGAAGNTNDTETVFLSKNIAAAANHTVDTFALANVETVNLNVRDIAGTGVTTKVNGIVDTSLTTLTLQGTAVNPDPTSTTVTKSAALVLGTGFSASTTTNGVTTGITKVDASGYNNDVDATGLGTSGAISTKGAAFLGGAGILTATGNTGADAFTAGAGGGVFTGGAGADTYNLALQTKASTINIGANDSTISTFDSAFGFHTGGATVADTIKFTDVAGTKAAAVTNGSTGIVGTTVTINSAGLATVNGGDGTLNGTINAVKGYLDSTNTAGTTAAVVFGNDSYVVHEGNTTATDSLVKIVGQAVTGVDTGFGAGLVHIA